MTIYALSTGPGVSGLAVIRISGKETKVAINKITGKSVPKPRTAVKRKFNKISDNQLIDEGILLWFPGPASYTGEDMAEFHVHGSRAVIKEIQNSLSKIPNLRLAEAGEFTKLAFQNGKINLLKAESVSDLISSETEIQRQQAIKVMSGKSSEKFNSLRERLLKILSKVEAKIDFPEDDLPENILLNIHSETKNIREEIKKILNDQKVGERIREGFKISILGPTNAGKSSSGKSILASTFDKIFKSLSLNELNLSELFPDIILIACCLWISVSEEIKSEILSALRRFIFPF